MSMTMPCVFCGRFTEKTYSADRVKCQIAVCDSCVSSALDLKIYWLKKREREGFNKRVSR